MWHVEESIGTNALQETFQILIFLICIMLHTQTITTDPTTDFSHDVGTTIIWGPPSCEKFCGWICGNYLCT